MKTKARYVWVRLGDTCEYEKYDDVQGAAGYLKEAGVHGPLGRVCGNHGLMAPGYEGCNHISIYWGDHEAQLSRDLNLGELVILERRLA